MNKTALTSFTLLCLLSTVFLMGCKISVEASPDIIYVPTNYLTIQEAINAANPGDSIFVYSGTYYENVVVNKTVLLVGEDGHSTIIDGGGTDNVIDVTADNVNINGFTIQNSGSTDSDSGIYVISSSNNISHNTITNNRNGIYLYYSSGNVVSGNSVYSNNWYGIYLYHSSGDVVSGNNLYSNYNDGIYLYYSSGNVISGNSVHSNNNGINLYYSSDNVISGNSVSNNDCGVWICQLSSNNVISGNNAYSNYNGIYLYYSSYNLVSDNNISSNNDYGIYLHHSSTNMISKNNAYSNNLYGIYLYYSSNDNTIYHNNFVNNKDQVWTDSVNLWNYDHEGNYWSDYTEQDLNEDGTGDAPYVIDANNQDNHPLMGILSNFKITRKEENYQVTTVSNSTISEFRFEIGPETGNKIIRFSVTGENGTVGFCRVKIPTQLMNYSCLVLVDEKEIITTLLDFSDNTHAYLYFTYIHSSHTITIISSKTLYLYNELLGKYAELQIDFNDLNSTYHELLNNQSTLLSNYIQLLEIYTTLNLTSHELLDNYSQLLERYAALNASYQEHLLNYSELQANYTYLLLEHTQNIRSLIYVFIATATIFIIAAVYLSTHAHRKVPGS